MPRQSGDVRDPGSSGEKAATVAIIPAFNEEGTIEHVVNHVLTYLDHVVVIDDGSTDSTAAIAEMAGVKVISHVLNRGVGAAMRTGYRYACEHGFVFILQLDGDGQHDPKYIPEFLQAIDSGFDIVIGSRFIDLSYQQYSFVRRAGIRFFTHLCNLLSARKLTDITSGFRAYRTEALRKLERNQDKHWAVEQTLEAARKGLRIKELSVDMPTRAQGTSQFRLGVFLWYPIRMLDVILRVLIFRGWKR
ncbi:glycosyltransferase family 2 protein [Candidatus Bipolaricaulota bacterium]